MPGSREIDDPTSTPGGIRTGMLFANIIYQYGDRFLWMLETDDKGYVSSTFLNDAGPLITEAIKSGRQPDGWLSRTSELEAAKKALTLRFNHLSPDLLEDLTEEMRHFFTQVGESINPQPTFQSLNL